MFMILAMILVISFRPCQVVSPVIDGTLLEDAGGNLWETYDELENGRYIVVFNTKGTPAFEDDEILFVIP